MKKITTIITLAVLLVTLSGCFRMQIQNAPRPELNNFEQGKWHHTGIFGLVEFSDPVNLQKECDGSQWQTIQTQETAIQGLVRFVTFGLYAPWDVNVKCSGRTK